MITLLDGPLGTELSARGVSTELPLWSAAAIDSAPEVVAAIHRDYVKAGATVHTTNTFRTQRRTVGGDWLRMTREAVRITQRNVPPSQRIAGSISPLEDCYRPDLSPRQESRTEHREMAEALAEAGCDLLLCETFPNIEEAIVAVEEATRTGMETWLALTAGPDATLLTPEAMADGARQAVQSGAAAVLVNCTPARATLPYVMALASANLGVPIGAYANAGSIDDQVGWRPSSELASRELASRELASRELASRELASRERGAILYGNYARQWIEAGATLIGGCCGTTPKHIAALCHEFC